MKKSASVVLIAIVSVLFSLVFSSSKTIDYNKQWAKVEKFQKEGLPKSALKIVNQIYNSAKEEENSPQIIKSLIYKIKLQQPYVEDADVKAIKYFEKETLESGVAVKQLLYSLTAQLYDNYYQSNKWEIYERKTLSNYQNSDIKTWDAQSFERKIKSLYLQSLQNPEILKSIQTEDYGLIMTYGDSTNFKFQPSLYDLLANRLIDYLDNPYLTDPRGAEKNYYNKAIVDADKFLQLLNDDYFYDENDSIIASAFAGLIEFHTKNADTTALIDLELKRLLYYNLMHENKTADDAYLKALFNLKNKYLNNELSAKIAIKIAVIYKLNAEKYEPLKGEKYRWLNSKALAVLNEAIKNFPNSKYSQKCRSMADEIKSQKIDFQFNEVELPEKNFPVLFNFKNIDKVFFRIYHIKKGDDIKQVENVVEFFKNKKADFYLSYNLPNEKDYQSHSTELSFPKLPIGHYIVIASPDSAFSNNSLYSYKQLNISQLSWVKNDFPNYNKTEISVLNRQSGKTVGDVEIVLSERTYNRRPRGYVFKEYARSVSDKNGKAVFQFNNTEIQRWRQTDIKLVKDNDSLSSYSYINTYAEHQAKSRKKTFLFTDRSVYRPGQTIYFKGIIVEQTGNDFSILKNTSTTVELYNANNKIIGSDEFTTNEFGSFSGSFVLPNGILNGNFYLKDKWGWQNFSVEEYKRPNFRMVFDTIKEQYKIGDSITISGYVEDFTSNRLENTNIEYYIESTPFMPYYFYSNSSFNGDEIGMGNTVSNANGEFKINFLAVGDYDSGNDLSFNINIDATDISGETHEANKVIRLNNDRLNLITEFNDYYFKNSGLRPIINVKNCENIDIATKAKISIYKLQTPENYYLQRNGNQPDIYLLSKTEYKNLFPHHPYKDEDKAESWESHLIKEKEININGSTSLNQSIFNDLEQADYMVIISIKDKNGTEISKKQFFSLIDEKSKKTVSNNPFMAFSPITNCEAGNKIVFYISSATKARAYYLVKNNNKLLASASLKLNNNRKKVELQLPKDIKGKIDVFVYSVINNHLFNERLALNIIEADTSLDISLETLRDYIEPGSKEEWKVKIKNSGGDGVLAELLAAMYDASLDKIKPHNWYFNFHKNHKRSEKPDFSKFIFGSSITKNEYRRKYFNLNELYPEIDFMKSGYHIRGSRYLDGMALDAKVSEVVTTVEGVSIDDDTEEQEEVVSASEIVKSTDEKESNTIQYRRDFRETAFFFPQLKTNDKGEVILNFKTPDALTEWKIMLLAYDKNLQIGQLSKNIVARKQMMIMPNIPRFFRAGDQMDFSARLVNYSEKAIDAKVKIEFFNAINMSPLQLTSNNLLNVKVGAKSNKLLKFNIKIPNNVDMITYRLSAESDDFSDAEQRMIPIMSNRKLITETLPLFVNPRQNKTYDFTSISKNMMSSATAEKQGFSIEFASNPIWYAIQALPYLSNKENESSLALFNTYFANSISSYIINSNPEIKTVFETWKNINPGALQSQLEKNPDLKSALLEASPWLRNAENENEQKRKIALLFDINNLSMQKQQVLEKLRNLQLNSGAWSWFKGMSADVYTTQNIVLGLARLQHNNIIVLKDNTMRNNMVKRALIFLDNEIKSDYDDLVKKKLASRKTDNLGSLKIQYLYLRSLLIKDYPLDNKYQRAFNYYIKQAETHWLRKPNYLQAMIALALNELSYRNQAEGIIRSLEERSLEDEEMGIYWKQKSGWNWFEAGIESQAMIIEAFTEIDKREDLINKMKIWLLKQKQTNSWETTSATAQAILVLLNNHAALVQNPNQTDILLDGKKLDLEGKTEAGTNYFRMDFDASETTPQKIEINNSSSSIGWGAAYLQYFEDLDKIQSSAKVKGLEIEKVFFVEKQKDNETVIEPLKKGDKLKKGQKLVSRIIIRSDRKFEFIHLRDMRSAAVEPKSSSSGYQWGNGLSYYINTSDINTDFFIRYLPKGTYVLEYDVFVSQSGNFSSGNASIQSMYAPGFAAHSKGFRIIVE